MPAAFPVETSEADEAEAEEIDGETASHPNSPLHTSRRLSTTTSLDNVDLEDTSPPPSMTETPAGMLFTRLLISQYQWVPVLIAVF